MNNLIGIGTLLVGVGTVVTAFVSVWTLRTARAVKADVAENTSLTNDVHEAVVPEETH